MLVSEVLSANVHDVVKYSYKYNIKTGLAEKPKIKKIKIYTKTTGMWDDNYMDSGLMLLLNGVEVLSHKFNKKEVVGSIVYSIENKEIPCLVTIKGGQGRCYNETVGVEEIYYNNPMTLYQFDFIKKTIKKVCRTQKKKKDKEECDEFYHKIDSAMTKLFTEDKILQISLFFFDENKKNLKHQITRTFLEGEIKLLYEMMDFHLSELDNVEGEMDNYAYSQKIVKTTSLIPFEEAMSETVTTPIKNPSENKIIEEVISSIKNLSQSKISNPKIDPELMKKIYSVMIAAEKRLGTGKIYLQSRN